MKKHLLLMMILLVAVFAAACGSSDGENGESMEAGTASSDGWEIYFSDETAPLPENVQAAFDKAIEDAEMPELRPVAYIASQVVSGTNHMILCNAVTGKDDVSDGLQMVVIYEDLNGEAELTIRKDFDINSYVEGESLDISQEKLAGGWTVPEAEGLIIPAKARKAFSEATETYTGDKPVPVALLGIKADKDTTSYAILCRCKSETDDSVTNMQVFTITRDDEYNCQIAAVGTIDPAGFNE